MIKGVIYAFPKTVVLRGARISTDLILTHPAHPCGSGWNYDTLSYDS